MTEKNQTLLVHTACVLVIVLCIGIACLTPMAAYPAAGGLLFGLATWLYGKLTGTPATPVLNQIIAKMEPERVEQIMSQHPPATAPTDGGPS